jgi:hypothetical protein
MGRAFGRTLASCLGALAVCSAAAVANAQILYMQPDPGGSGLSELRQINPDGTGDVALGLNLPQARFPTQSLDGRFLAVTSRDPNRPTQITQNVYQLDRLTGQLRQLTFFEDFVDSQTGNSTVILSLFKSFSPDNSRIAVTSLETVTTSSGVSTTPRLRIFNTSTGLPEAPIAAGPFLDGAHTTGFGLQWLPALGPADARSDAQRLRGSSVRDTALLLRPEPGSRTAAHVSPDR